MNMIKNNKILFFRQIDPTEMATQKYINNLIKKTKKKYLQLNIVHKMLLGFLPLSGLTILLAAFALTNLNNLNRINQSIIQANIPFMQATENMIDSLYAQELHGNRYIILKSPEKMELFTDAALDFKNQLITLNGLPEKDPDVIEQLSYLHAEYNSTFLEWFKLIDNPSLSRDDFKNRIEEIQNEMVEYIQTVSGQATAGLNQKMLQASHLSLKALRVFGILCIFSILFGVGIALLITQNISSAVKRLKSATLEISQGKFDHNPNIRNQDELGDLSRSFTKMAQRLKSLEEMYLDTSPLTRLPGGIAIENILKKRIDSEMIFAFCLVDLDNFKVFNDKYGYARGNKVIKNTAEIIEKAVKKHGTKETFIGHIGGDDFVVMTAIDNYEKICQFIIDQFDRMVVEMYDPKDVSLGCITQISRNGRKKKFPLMTISIGVVKNDLGKFKHFVEVGEIAAEVKNYAKAQPGSLYFVDRRLRDEDKPGQN
ncbi:MAG: diguanylate cyclase [Candidatus Aminicenantes bacterium]|nr:diguanylate cyclase [Candidatus Aminicenantes bacterium]